MRKYGMGMMWDMAIREKIEYHIMGIRVLFTY